MKEQSIAEIHVVPLGTATTSLSRYVAAVMEILKEAKDIKYQLTAMGTIIQGPLERIFEVAQKMHEVPFTMGVQRVATTLYIDDRRDKLGSIEGKVKSVEEKLKSR
jgi:uncharacterized protein (TIGR00106 family)